MLQKIYLNKTKHMFEIRLRVFFRFTIDLATPTLLF